jgi:hypothetical protein
MRVHWNRVAYFFWLIAALLLAFVLLRLGFVARILMSIVFGLYFQYAIGPMVEDEEDS